MSTYTGNQLIAAINDGSILESGVGNSLRITFCTDQQLATIIDYLVQHDLAANLTELDLREGQLTRLPESIGNLNNLKMLNLSFNKINNLPDSFENLNNLTRLFLSHNQLTSLPESIGNFKNLTTLRLNFNKLTSLPESIANLSNLTTLSLNFNRLTSLPRSFGNLKSLTKCDLDNNPLKTLPIVALNWKNKALTQNILFTELQKKLQLEVEQFSDIMAGLVATYLDLANKLGHYDKNLCDTFYKIFLAEGNDNPMASRIMCYALQDADETNEPQITADKKGFWPFFIKKRGIKPKMLKRQQNKLEPEAIEPGDKLLTTTSNIMGR